MLATLHGRLPDACWIAVISRAVLAWSRPVTVSPRLTRVSAARLADRKRMRRSPPYLHYRVLANKLSKGEHLLTANGTVATADGGTNPKVRDGWMWDLTIPGDGDHDFYVIPDSGSYHDAGLRTHYVEAGDTPVLVHNSGCGPRFAVNSIGTAIDLAHPTVDTATGVLSPTGKGMVYDVPGGMGLNSRVTQVRVMNPVTTGKYQYPNGYVVYMNRTGQTVNPLSGRVVANSDPYAHIPLP